MIKDIEELSESAIVKKAVENILGLSKPNIDIVKYLDGVTSLSEKDGDSLTKVMSVYTRWQNYFGEQFILTDALKTAAESQMNYYWSIAIERAKGTINSKKELAANDDDYVKAKEVYEVACSAYNALRMKFENCERCFKLASRILTKRLNLKFED